jgi:hypothetical protein
MRVLLLLVVALLLLAMSSSAQQCPTATSAPTIMMRQVMGGYTNQANTTQAYTYLEEVWPQLPELCASLPLSRGWDQTKVKVCSYATQVVAGLNIRITFVYAGATHQVQLFRSLPQPDVTLSVTSCALLLEGE